MPSYSNAIIRKLSKRAAISENPGFVSGGELNYVSPLVVSIGLASSPSSVHDSVNVQNIQWTGAINADISVSGVNGLDVGSLSINTWYYVYVIANKNNALPVSSLISLSPTTPIIPSGYTRFRRLGSIRVNSSGTIQQFSTSGNAVRRYFFRNINSRVIIVGGAATTWVTLDLSSLMPPTSTLAYVETIQRSTNRFTIIATNSSTIDYIQDPGSGASYWIKTTPTQTIVYTHLFFLAGGNTVMYHNGYEEKI